MKVGNPYNIITGCIILDKGKVLFSEYNFHEFTDGVTLNDSNGNHIRTVQEFNPSERSFYDIASFDTNRIAVSIYTCISIVNIDKQNILHKITSDRRCYGITHCDGKLYHCSYLEGIRRFDMKIETNQLLIPTDIGEFSYISCDRNKLFYTPNTESVNCCDINGKSICRLLDTSLRRSPRGAVVNNQGFVFVAGEQSRNIVVISPDGNSSKEEYHFSSPRVMCYDKYGNTILVCNTGRKAFWFQIE
jgi:DNA-binding beta-propeller fold protein YncE